MDYSFGNKAQYRRTLWRFIDDNCDRPLKDRVVVYLDTKQALETKFLIHRGYNPSNLHAVNFNPAEVAHLTRTLVSEGLPKVRTHGVDIFKVVHKVTLENGRIDALNLDFCGQITKELTFKLKEIQNLFQDRMLVGVTVLRGREKAVFKDISAKKTARATTEALEHCVVSNPLSTDIGRVRALMRAIINKNQKWNIKISNWRWGFYRSTAGSQTMFFTVMLCEKETTQNIEAGHLFPGCKKEMGEFMGKLECISCCEIFNKLYEFYRQASLDNSLSSYMKKRQFVDKWFAITSADALIDNREDWLGRDSANHYFKEGTIKEFMEFLNARNAAGGNIHIKNEEHYQKEYQARIQ